jgi:hypothetical protein
MNHHTHSDGPAATLQRRGRWRRSGAAALALVAGALVLSPTAHAANQYRVEITNLASGLRADVMWAKTNPGQGVFLWPNNSSASQEFDLLDDRNGYFQIRARHSRLCLRLDPRGGAYTNGTPVIQDVCRPGRQSAEWRRGWVGHAPECDGEVCSSTGVQFPVLVNRFTRKCLDTRNPASRPPRAQAVLQQWTCIRYANDWNAGNQLWRFGNESYL